MYKPSNIQATSLISLLLASLICGGSQGPPDSQNRRIWNATLSNFETKYLVLHTKTPSAADFSRLGSAVMEPTLPYDLRVKSAVLLARICRQEFDSVQVCKDVLSALNTQINQAPSNEVLASYIQNIAFSKIALQPVSRDVAQVTDSLVSESAPLKAESALGIAAPTGKASYTWILLIGALIGVILVSGLRLLFAPAMARVQTALLVDDDPTTLLVMKRLLASLGIEAETFVNPLEALKRYSTHKFDLVVLDYAMPEMNGDDLARSMSELPRPQPNLVFYTGKTDRVQNALKTLGPRISEVISKSEDIQSLRRIFEKVTGKTAA